jgi:parvulin-like peptidyl-prolyl isomerase
MKKFTLSAIIIILSAGFLFGQVIDQPVARVRLTKSEVITQKQLRRQIELLEQQTKQPMPAENRKKMLDLQIGEILINQAAARDNFRVSDTELSESVERYKRSVGQQITDAQFRLIVQNQLNMSWDEFLNNMRQRLIQERYIMEKKKTLFTSIQEASESQINQIYDANATDFTNPQMVRFNHIFIDTRNLGEAERTLAKRRAEDALKELRTAQFKDVVMKFSDDTSSKYRGGDFGYLPRNDAQRQMLFGSGFIESVFSLSVNQTSGVVQSNLGFHIVQLTERRDAKLLGLNDLIFPGAAITVRERIKDLVRAQNQQLVFQKALNELITELRSQAEVTVFEQNLNW